MSEYLQDSIFNYQPSQNNTINQDRPQTKEKELVFSYSRMSLYQECPLKYKFKYIDKIPEKPKKFFFIGRVVHKVLEYFYSKIPPPSVQELKEIALKEWKATSYQEKGYLTQEYEDIDFLKILNIITNYHKKHADNDRLPFLLEYSTYVTIDGYKLTIVADKIEYHSNGRITIIDYKTGKEGERTPTQLYFYQKVCESDPLLIKKVMEKYSEKIERITVENMVYYYVENLKEIIYPRAKDSEIERFWEEALNVIENINSKKFDPTPSEKACKWCDFKQYCEVYYSKSNTDIVKLVNEYVKLNSELERIKKEIDELKSKITQVMKRENKNTIVESNIKITLRKKINIDDVLKNKDKIKKILMDFNLYDKASRITVSALEEVFYDPSTPKDAVDKLKELISEEESVSFE